MPVTENYMGNVGRLALYSERRERGFFMRKPRRTCPQCGIELKPKQIVPSGSFSCPSCGADLQVSIYYLLLLVLVAVIVPGVIFKDLRFSWVHVLIGELLVLCPVLYSLRWAKYVIPPPLDLHPPVESSHLRDHF